MAFRAFARVSRLSSLLLIAFLAISAFCISCPGHADGAPSTMMIDGGAAATSSTAVTLDLSFAVGSKWSEMCFSNDAAIWSDWKPYAASSLWTLLPGDGPKTVYVQFRDSTGKLSAPTSGSIVLDTVPPDAKAVIIAQWNPLQVQLGGDVVAYSYSMDGGPYSDTVPASTVLPLVAGTHTMAVVAEDAAGNRQSVDKATAIIWTLNSPTSWTLSSPYYWIAVGATLPQPPTDLQNGGTVTVEAMPPDFYVPSISIIGEQLNLEGATNVPASGTISLIAGNRLTGGQTSTSGWGDTTSISLVSSTSNVDVTTSTGNTINDILLPITGGPTVDPGAGVYIMYPSDGKTNVETNSGASVNFGKAIDCSKVTSNSLNLTTSAANVAGTVSCTGDKILFTPASLLLPGTTYTATLNMSNLSTPMTWSFTTAPPNTKTYTIHLSAGTGGNITADGALSVTPGESRTVTITPNTGYHIASVSINGKPSGTKGNYVLKKIGTDQTVAANFAPNTCLVAVKAGKGGTISSSSQGPLLYGDSRSYSIVPAEGYEVSDVIVDKEHRGAVPAITLSDISGNHTVSAVFAKKQYTITVPQVTGGTISAGGAVTHGASKTFTIKPAKGYKVQSIILDGVSHPGATKFRLASITADHTLTALFEPVSPAK